VVVTSEVGLGLVPETPLGRTFRDVAGLAHQRLAAAADEVYFGALGLMLRLKPGPVVSAAEALS
jgi:adenosylcobinamide kinase/adenosylcobinamide-phosphate guanylyltransferase